MELDRKDYFCEVKKVHVLTKLQASYNTKLLRLYDELYEQGYWVGYAKKEHIAQGGQEGSLEGTPEPTRSTESAEPTTQWKTFGCHLYHQGRGLLKLWAKKLGFYQCQQGKGLPKLGRLLTQSSSLLFCTSSRLL